MAVAVVHATTAAGPNDPSKQVSSDAWNEGHTITGLGTAATANTGDFDAAGTAAAAIVTHVGLADPHTQYALESSLATVATSGAYADLSGKPTLGTAAAAATTDFAAADSDLAAIAALAAGGIAVQTAVGVWAQRTITGTAARVSVTNGSGVGGNPTIDIDATYVGQASLTTVGTIVSGIWNAGAVTSSGAISAVGQMLAGTGTQAAPSYSWTAQTDLGFWRNAAHTITLSSNTGTGPALRFLGSDARTGTLGCGPSSGLDLTGSTLRLLGTGGTAAARLAALSVNAATIYWQLLDENAADILALRRGTNAQTYRVYGTFTDTSNYARASLSCSTTATTLAAEGLGTGANQNLILAPAGTGTVQVPTVAAGTNSVAAASAAYAMSAAPNASYRVILDCSGSLTAASAAATYGFGQGIPVQVSGTGTAAPANTIYIAAADFPTVNGLTAKLKVRAQVFCNDVAPGVTFTFGLHPVTRPATSGGVGLVIYTIGAAVAGSTGAIATPAADSSNVIASSDFSLPADGHYVLGVVTSGGALAASSHVHMSVALQLRNA